MRFNLGDKVRAKKTVDGLERGRVYEVVLVREREYAGWPGSYTTLGLRDGDRVLYVVNGGRLLERVVS